MKILDPAGSREADEKRTPSVRDFRAACSWCAPQTALTELKTIAKVSRNAPGHKQGCQLAFLPAVLQRWRNSTVFLTMREPWLSYS
jgi:hypothetical protein